MDKYMKLAKRALQILEINYAEDENIENLLKKLENAMPLYASSTEREISELTVKIANEIRKMGDIDIIKNMLEKLEYEVSYLPWD